MSLNWNGPTSKIWSDSQCQNLENLEYDVTKCKQSCEAKNLCTAFNYNPNGGCSLRACSLPVPDPTWALGNYRGYYLNKGTYTLTVLKHSKKTKTLELGNVTLFFICVCRLCYKE